MSLCAHLRSRFSASQYGLAFILCPRHHCALFPRSNMALLFPPLSLLRLEGALLVVSNKRPEVGRRLLFSVLYAFANMLRRFCIHKYYKCLSRTIRELPFSIDKISPLAAGWRWYCPDRDIALGTGHVESIKRNPTYLIRSLCSPLSIQ